MTLSVTPPHAALVTSTSNASAQVVTQTFQAALKGSSNTSVQWGVDGMAGGSASAGDAAACRHRRREEYESRICCGSRGKDAHRDERVKSEVHSAFHG